jgi:hypothetical protein
MQIKKLNSEGNVDSSLHNFKILVQQIAFTFFSTTRRQIFSKIPTLLNRFVDKFLVRLEELFDFAQEAFGHMFILFTFGCVKDQWRILRLQTRAQVVPEIN